MGITDEFIKLVTNKWYAIYPFSRVTFSDNLQHYSTSIEFVMLYKGECIRNITNLSNEMTEHRLTCGLDYEILADEVIHKASDDFQKYMMRISNDIERRDEMNHA